MKISLEHIDEVLIDSFPQFNFFRFKCLQVVFAMILLIAFLSKNHCELILVDYCECN